MEVFERFDRLTARGMDVLIFIEQRGVKPPSTFVNYTYAINIQQQLTCPLYHSDFTRAFHEPANNNGCDPMPKKGLDTPAATYFILFWEIAYKLENRGWFVLYKAMTCVNRCSLMHVAYRQMCLQRAFWTTLKSSWVLQTNVQGGDLWIYLWSVDCSDWTGNVLLVMNN
jgi:hypothetical protein